MGYTKIPPDHSEFGGGDGSIDPSRRVDRTSLTPAEERMEIMATNPIDPDSDPATVALGGSVWPVPYVWPDSSTAEGTA